jgi:3-deoxy-D-manno-octulosonic-acid transferase
MFLLYNILQLVFLPIFSPFITIFVLCSSKYRDRIPARLGFGLAHKIAAQSADNENSRQQTIWLHALSVGEVTSVVPLAAALRKKYPDTRIIVSVTTRTGKKVADAVLNRIADHIIDSPLDVLPVVARFVKYIQPSLFILVETDLWPNILLFLRKKGVPTILVNGRVSQESMASYQKLRFFFDPMFQSFSFLCMQTKRDRDKLENFGIPPEKLHTLGNLKFDTTADQTNASFTAADDLLPEDRVLFICGSTHPGEEKILIDCYSQVKKTNPELFLIIAPRDIRRAAEIQALATEQELSVALRSNNSRDASDILVIDTIGELIHFYAASDIGFVGGSLVKRGGHNPIEPATFGIPVIFGPNMQDFSEIAAALLIAEGATEVAGSDDLARLLKTLLASPQLRKEQGLAALQCVKSQRGVIAKHLELITQLL